MAISPIDFPFPSPIASALRAIQEANKSVAEVAQDVAENGSQGLAENVVTLIQAETAVKANAEVIRTVNEIEDEVLDILA